MLRRAACWVVLLMALLGGRAPAEDTSEYRVKAAFLYNFTKFVEWPAGALGEGGSPFVIGILGRDPFGTALDNAVSGKSIDGHPFVVRRYRQIGDLGQCQLLFVSESERDKVGRIIGKIGRNTLAVADMDRFLQHGGAINFYIDDSKVRFEINPDAAEASGLKISSKLLSLARVVHPK